MTAEREGFSSELDERRRELDHILDRVSYELTDARHRSLDDPSACQSALDRAMKKLADARALAAAEAASR